MDIGFDSPELLSSSAPEPIVKQGGSAQISDDEINVIDYEEPSAKAAAKKDLAKKIDTKARDEKDNASEGKKAAKEVAAEEAVKQEIKKALKIKSGDTELDLAEDALVPVKVDGKVTQVPLKDLLSEFSGKTDWTRKYQDLHNEKKSFYDERDTITNRVNEFYRLSVEEKNPRLAIDLLAEAMGADPQEVWTNLMAPIKEAMKNAPQLSPEEIAVNETKEELEYYRRKEKMRKSEGEKARENEGLLSRIKETQEKLSMSPDQFKKSYDELVAEADKSGFDISALTPEMVGEYFQIVDRKSKIQGFVVEAYADSEKQSDIEMQLYDTWSKNPEFTLDDIKDIAGEVYGSKKAKASRLVERVKESKTKEKVLPQHEPLSWDDL
jgi:hypothetical protein